MIYKISARYPGRRVTLAAADEEAALAKCAELATDGVPFEITDSDGAEVDEIDLEDRIDARGDPEA